MLRRNSFAISNECFVDNEKSTLHSTVDKTVFSLFDNYYRLLKSWSLFLRTNSRPIRWDAICYIFHRRFYEHERKRA